MGIRIVCVIVLLLGLAANMSSQTVRLSTAGVKSQNLLPYKPPVSVLRLADRLKALQSQAPNLFDQGFVSNAGTSGSNFNLKTGEVWGASINDGSGSEDWAGGGFQTNGIQNTGTSPWRGVTVTAEVEIISMTGSPVTFVVGYPNSGGYYPKWVIINSPGRHTITSQAFDMPPNQTFQGCCHVYVMPGLNTPAGVYAKVISIKMNL